MHLPTHFHSRPAAVRYRFVDLALRRSLAVLPEWLSPFVSVGWSAQGFFLFDDFRWPIAVSPATSTASPVEHS